jgi:alpha-galactosidase
LIKQDAVIEYRQNYVGPAITQYCNLLRVADCAFDSITNRIAINDMRLLNYPLAVHSDMLYWSENDCNENVAIQLNNILFSVPQISVLLTEDTKEHIQTLKNYVTYWQENKDILMHGDFHVFGMDSNYTMAYAENNEKRIVATYVQSVIKCEEKQLDILNASNNQDVIIESGNERTAKSYDCLGKLIEERKIIAGVNKIKLPLGGRVEVR